jgi:hypothetical protein
MKFSRGRRTRDTQGECAAGVPQCKWCRRTMSQSLRRDYIRRCRTFLTAVGKLSASERLGADNDSEIDQFRRHSLAPFLYIEMLMR